jgi:hypothetical protein
MANLLLHSSRPVHLIYGPPRKSCQLQRSRGGSGLIVVPTKNDKSRVIRLGPATVETFMVHRESARTRR